ncbi:MAG: hypothetical protein PHV05_03230 [Candidatus Riflebacteria bacterium]|nr:hypothetical protein [Candidatus Riflebacteria bacterium]
MTDIISVTSMIDVLRLVKKLEASVETVIAKNKSKNAPAKGICPWRGLKNKKITERMQAESEPPANIAQPLNKNGSSEPVAINHG